MKQNAKKKLRFKLFKLQNGRCILCGKGMKKNKITLEHLQPRSKGGGDNLGNLGVAHGSCNSRKGNMSLAEWLRSKLK